MLNDVQECYEIEPKFWMRKCFERAGEYVLQAALAAETRGNGGGVRAVNIKPFGKLLKHGSRSTANIQDLCV